MGDKPQMLFYFFSPELEAETSVQFCCILPVCGSLYAWLEYVHRKILQTTDDAVQLWEGNS